jgi:hypothetical protein
LGENPWIRGKVLRSLNLATYLPEVEGEPLHSCEEVSDKVFSSQPHLVDTAIPNADLELFTDGSQSPQEREQVYKTGAKENSEGWFITLEERILIPEKAATGLVRLARDITHLGKTSLQGLLEKHLVIPQLATLTQLVSNACLRCAQHNPGQGPRPPLLVQKRGVYSFQRLEIDFTEIQSSKTYRYLLVVVCTFTGWVEAHPTHTEKAIEVSRALAKEIIPRFGMPSSIGSDNGPILLVR